MSRATEVFSRDMRLVCTLGSSSELCSDVSTCEELFGRHPISTTRGVKQPNHRPETFRLGAANHPMQLLASRRRSTHCHCGSVLQAESSPSDRLELKPPSDISEPVANDESETTAVGPTFSKAHTPRTHTPQQHHQRLRLLIRCCDRRTRRHADSARDMLRCALEPLSISKRNSTFRRLRAIHLLGLR
jgi:hypothetical protein